MTSLQVDYWKLEETARTNRANEGLRADELAETIRHNQATESIGWAQINEAARHNQATEAVQRFQAVTDRRHWTQWASFQEQTLALQAESNEIQRIRADAYAQEVQISQYRADTDRFRVEQSVRQTDEQIAISRNEQRRKWFETIFNSGVNISREYRGWADTVVDAVPALGSALGLLG